MCDIRRDLFALSGEKETPLARLLRGLDLKAEIVRRRLYIYDVGTAVRINPSRFSALINERLPLSDELARRIQAAINELSEAA